MKDSAKNIFSAVMIENLLIRAEKYDSKSHNVSSTLYICDSSNYNIYICIIKLNYINKVYPSYKAIWGVAY